MGPETRSDRLIVGRLHRTQEFESLIRLLEGPLKEEFILGLQNAKNQEEASRAVFRWQTYQRILILIKEAVEKGDRSAE